MAHLSVRKVTRIGYHRRRVAAEPPIGEDIDRLELHFHKRYFLRSIADDRIEHVRRFSSNRTIPSLQALAWDASPTDRSRRGVACPGSCLSRPGESQPCDSSGSVASIAAKAVGVVGVG